MSPFLVLEEFKKFEREKEEQQKLSEILEPLKPEVKPVVDTKVEGDKRMLTSAKIVERMLNLNTYGELARDFRFYEVKISLPTIENIWTSTRTQLMSIERTRGRCCLCGPLGKD